MKTAWFGAYAVVFWSGTALFAAEASVISVVSVASHGGSATATAWTNYDGNGFGGFGFTETRVNRGNSFSFARGRSAGLGEGGFRQSQSYGVVPRFGLSVRGTTNPRIGLGRGSSVNVGRVRSNNHPSRRVAVRGLVGNSGSHRGRPQAVSATYGANGSRQAVRARTHSAQRREFASRRHETRRSHGRRSYDNRQFRR